MEALIYKGLEGVGFTETNPDKGTETIRVDGGQKYIVLFTETNPDKGTETHISFSLEIYHNRLQKLTPIRGRKLLKETHSYQCYVSFTETNPDKGTETT